MSEVWKYPIEPGDRWLDLPKGSTFLHVGVQDGQPYVWALVHPEQPLRRRHIATYGTGHRIDGSPSYLGSFMLHGGRLVFHTFTTSSELPLSYEPPSTASQDPV